MNNLVRWDLLFKSLAASLAMDDPDTAAMCASALPDGSTAQRDAVYAVVTGLSLADPQQAKAWAQKLPAGSVKSAALATGELARDDIL